MTPAEEDALVAQFSRVTGFGLTSNPDRGTDIANLRLAIRAAVAAERERAARVCEEFEPKSFTTDGMITRAMCAAAIRRGHD